MTYNLLFVEACVRGPQSRTLRLAERFLRGVPDATVQTRSLPHSPLAPLKADTLALRDQLSAQNAFDDPFFAPARQFQAADAIILAAPYWDLSFPSLLRAYLEHICVTGITFHYTPEGQAVGDCRARRLVFVTTRGGVPDPATPALSDFAQPYLRSLCALLGIARFDCLSAQGLDILGNDAEALLCAAERQADALADAFWQPDAPA